MSFVRLLLDLRICVEFDCEMGLWPMMALPGKQRFTISITTSTGRRPVSQ